MRVAWRTIGPRAIFAGYVAALALGVVAGGHQAAAGAESCAPPPPWRESASRPGRPEAEFAACIRDQGYETRNLDVPSESAAYGIIAQCHVRVVFFEGRNPAALPATDQEDLRQAMAAVTHYRRCTGR
jgi:hypothetical protein